MSIIYDRAHGAPPTTLYRALVSYPDLGTRLTERGVSIGAHQTIGDLVSVNMSDVVRASAPHLSNVSTTNAEGWEAPKQWGGGAEWPDLPACQA